MDNERKREVLEFIHQAQYSRITGSEIKWVIGLKLVEECKVDDETFLRLSPSGMRFLDHWTALAEKNKEQRECNEECCE